MLKDMLRWVAIGGIFAIPIIIPFIVSASMFFPYITGKNFTFRIIVEVVFAVWVLLAFMDARYRPRFSLILGAVALFTLIVGIADLQGANAFKSFWSNFERMEGYIAILHLFLYFVVASAILNTEKLWTAFWYASVSVSVIISAIGLKPFIAVLPNMTALPRTEALFGNPIYLAIYCLFHIFITLILMLRWRGTVWHQVLLAVVVAVQIVTMVLTMTRGTVLGFIGGGILAAALIALFERERKHLRFAAIGGLALLALVLIGGYSVRSTEWAKTTPVVNRFTQINLSEGTVNARFMNWGMAWQGVKERPLLGWGQDDYEYVFSKYYNPRMYGEEPWFDRTHNFIFDWLIAAGFLGLIAYLLIPASLFAYVWAGSHLGGGSRLRSMLRFEGIRGLFKRRDHEFSVSERALWTGLIAAYLFHNLFVFDNIVSYIFYFSVLAYLHYRLTVHEKPLLERVRVPAETIVPVALPITLVVLIAVVYVVNIPGINTSRTLLLALMPQRALPSGQVVAVTPEESLGHFKSALEVDQLGRQEVREQVAQAAANILRTEGVPQAVKEEYATLAVDELTREVARNPDSARLRLLIGTLYSNLGQYDKAYEELLKARELTPTKQTALFQLGEIQLVRGDTTGAVETFKYAYELLPEYEEALKLYAYALIISGQDKTAVDLLTERFGTASIDDVRLLRAWTTARRFDIVAPVMEARVAVNPEDIQQQVSLAAVYREQGDRTRAIQLLAELAVKHPEYKDQINAFIAEIRSEK